MWIKHFPGALIAILMVNGFAYSYFAITFPSVGRALDFSDTNTGLILGISALVITLVSPFWGFICETRGRRKVLFWGILATTLFNILSAVVIHLRLELALSAQVAFMALLSVRMLNSLFTGGIKPGAQAQIADLTTVGTRARGMGLMGAAFGLGTIAGGFCAAISGIDFLIPAFIVISALLGLVCIYAHYQLPETLYSAGHKPQPIPTPIPIGRIWLFLLITWFALTMFSQLQHIATLNFEDRYGFDSHQAIQRSGVSMMLATIMMIVVQGLVIPVLQLKPRQLMILGCLAGILAMIILALAFNAWAFTLGLTFFGLGLGLMLPGNLAAMSLASPDSVQGKVAGLNGIGQGLGLASGPIFGALLHQFSSVAPFVGSAMVLGLVITMLMFLTDKG
ncbi:MAG: MFS transporter [Pseudomonadota bacterium]